MARAESTGVAKKLKAYHTKRDFARTPEPSGKARKRAGAARASFVVQKHAARRLHYDFRLEHAGVLLSWAVPKGPSLKPGERRLAVRTEDHPLEYADFEGIIPEGEYGGGAVIVWDRGEWTPEEDPERGLKAGRLTFDLHGEKLRGRFHLVRTRGRGGEKKEQWLLFKGKGEGASDSDIVEERGESVVSGRTLEDVRKRPERTWNSKKPAAEAATPVVPASATADTKALVQRLPLSFKLSNLDKLLYPEAKVRKADVIAYYATIAKLMLPHVARRPLTLKRCPNGAGTQCFFQKHANKTTPATIQRVMIAESDGEGEYMTIHDLDGLVALAQLGVLEIHTWGCHEDHVEQPDKLVFDIDPDPALDWELIVETAVEVRERLSDVGLESFVQTTGGKGLHVVAPVQPKLDWQQHKQFAHALVEVMAAENPERYLTTMNKAQRKGRIFLDYLRNGRGATAIAPYSTRAHASATVAAPITWDELMEGVTNADFTLRSMVERISADKYDPWKGYAKLKQGISVKALRGLRSS